MSHSVQSATHLTTEQFASLQTLNAQVTIHDEVEPFGEATIIGAQRAKDAMLHLWVSASTDTKQTDTEQPEDSWLGYLALDTTTSPQTVELAVHPEARRLGIATSLLQALRAQLEESTAQVALWSHGDLPAAQGLAQSLDLTPSRQLWRMEKPLANHNDLRQESTGEPVKQAELPTVDGQELKIRTFEPGDAQNWVKLNAQVFADHPEQGSLTMADLENRMRTQWFDPRGFFLAYAGQELLAYGWAKVDDQDRGELYVLGVSDKARGLGLGRILTERVEQYLVERDLQIYELYVDGGNTPAVKLYENQGFEVVEKHVQYLLTN